MCRKKMTKKSFIYLFTTLMTAAIAWMMVSCRSIHEDLPECDLQVAFKYDYNMLSADAFHTQVERVELYVFDENGIFLFSRSEEGDALKTGNFRMTLNLDLGKYMLMAWAGAGVSDSYSLTSFVPGSSKLTDIKLQLKRDASCIIDRKIGDLWYGEIMEVTHTGAGQTATINLIRDTNNIRFVFQGATPDWQIDADAYTYQLVESNGYLDYDNSLLDDDRLSYEPYYIKQGNESLVTVEINTLRLMANMETRFTVTHKTTGIKVFDINLIDFLAMTEMERYKWEAQEYFDRQYEFVIVFYFNGSPGETGPWVYTMLDVNDWTWYIQHE